jgi:hypothetical protein
MTARTGRLATVFVLLAASVLVCAITAAPAMAVTGATPQEAALLALNGPPLTADLATETIPGNGTYWLNLVIPAGQTVRITQTPGVGVVNMKSMFISPSDRPAFIPFTTTVDFIAARTDTYTVNLTASSLGTFTVQAVTIPAQKFSLTGLSVPSKAKKNKKFGISVRLSPLYSGYHPTVVFVVERRSGKFKPYTTVKSVWGYTKATYEPFSGTVKLPKGTFRIRAKFTDAAHKTPTYSAYKQVVVK